MRSNDREDEIFVAAITSARPEWSSFIRYCQARSKGLRKQAFDYLQVFITEAMTQPLEARLAFARWVLQWGFETQVNPLLTQPLHTGLLVPTLRDWYVQAPNDAQVHLWLGLLRQDNPSRHLERAIELDPHCEQAREVLSRWICGDVDYNQHELPYLYINDPRVDLDDLDRVVKLCTPYRKQRWALWIRREVAPQRKRAHAWLKRHPRPGDFATSARS